MLINLKAFLFHTHTPCFIHPTAVQHPHVFSPSGLSLDSEWVTLLFTIFQIPSQVFGLAGCPAFSLAITGLRGFSNGAFEEITLFSPSSREKTETFGQQLIQSITQTELKLCLTHLATKISSYLVCVWRHTDTHTFQYSVQSHSELYCDFTVMEYEDLMQN